MRGKREIQVASLVASGRGSDGGIPHEAEASLHGSANQGHVLHRSVLSCRHRSCWTALHRLNRTLRLCRRVGGCPNICITSNATRVRRSGCLVTPATASIVRPVPDALLCTPSATSRRPPSIPRKHKWGHLRCALFCNKITRAVRSMVLLTCALEEGSQRPRLDFHCTVSIEVD